MLSLRSKKENADGTSTLRNPVSGLPDRTKTILIIVLSVIIGAAVIAGIVCIVRLSIKAKATSNIKRDVNVTYGTPLTIDLFLEEGADPSTCSFASDVSVINMDDLATYEIKLISNGYKVKSKLNVVDDVPPVATAVPQTIYLNQLPDPNDCITDLYDKTEVTVDYGPDVTAGTEGVCTLPIVITDAYGNVTTIDCPFTIIDDHTAPIIDGYQDIYMVLGDTPLYREGITVTDDYDEHPAFTIDNSAVDFDTPGTYQVIYTATDEAGNNTQVAINLVIVATEEELEALLESLGPDAGRSSSGGSSTYKNYDDCTPADAYAAASKVVGSITTSSMSKVEKGLKIFYWANHSISFSAGSSSKDWAVAACQAFGRRRASCYGLVMACKCMCEVAGIPVRVVSATSGAHSWCLCYLNGGWYHCDAVRWRGGAHNFSFMKTDEEIAAAVGNHFYDGSNYPARSTLSVQAWINVANGTILPGMPTPTPSPVNPDPDNPDPSSTDSSETDNTVPSESSEDTGPSEPSDSSESQSESSSDSSSESSSDTSMESTEQSDNT